MRSLLAVAVSALILVSAGCGQLKWSHGRYTHLTREWEATQGRLGPTVLLVSTSPGPDLGSALGERLGRLPGTRMVATRPAPSLSDDAQILREAKDAGAQTAVVLCVEEWGYRPGITAHGQAEYRVRVLDAPSGKELLGSVHTLEAYGRTQEQFDAQGPELMAWSVTCAMGLPEPANCK